MNVAGCKAGPAHPKMHLFKVESPFNNIIYKILKV